jgi:ubiquinone/menaquinone biosynthesis C-methylase UbiE
VDFIQGLAEAVPFQDATFDFVYSCFLFVSFPSGAAEI